MTKGAPERDPAEQKVLSELVRRGYAADEAAARRVCVLIAGAAVGILEAGSAPGPRSEAAGDEADPPVDAAASRMSGTGKASVSGAVAALRAVQKGRRR